MIKAIIDDLKETWDTIKAIIEGEAKLRYPLKELIGTLDVWFKNNWYLILIFIGFTIAGYYLGYMKAGAQCTEVIMNMTQSNQPQFVLPNITSAIYS
jgi:hypothetical protein